MKSLNYWILMLLMATSCFTLVSCGDDDDEQGNGTTKKCHVDADGRNIVQSPNQKIPDRKTKCVIKTHINIKQNVIFGAKLKPV